LVVDHGSPDGVGAQSAGTGYGVSDDCEGDGERLGSALVVADFVPSAGGNFVAGAPRCTSGGSSATGGIFLREAGTVFPHYQTDYGGAGNGADDHFGTSLAAGDFDHDGFADLACGAPGKNHGAGSPDDSGRVYVVYGRETGPDFFRIDLIGEDEWAADAPQAGEIFGSALAVGDVDGDGFDDLLSGAPGEGATDVGRVYLKRGSVLGLISANNAEFTQTFLGGTNGDDDQRGNVLATGDIDGDGVVEIALGVPDKDVGTATDAGMVYVTRAFGRRLMVDGFESGNKTAWSASTP